MSSPALPRRVAAWLAGLWCGAVAALGLVAAPVLFATLPRAAAGDVASHLFAVDAALGLVVGALHGISAGFFVLKGLLVLALAWRLSATTRTATTS